MKPNTYNTYYFIAFIFAAFLGSPIFAQSTKAPNKTDAKGLKQGLWEGYYDTDTLKYRGHFKDGQPVGTFERYHENGTLQAELTYRKDHSAFAKIYDEDTGNRIAEGKYINQERDSTWLFFAADGSLLSKNNYRNGKKNGSSTVYYASGSVAEKMNFLNGVKNGKWQQFFEDGNPKLDATVVNGAAYDGQYTAYYPDGTKMTSGKYVDGLKESSWYHFNEDGSIEVIYVYRSGKVEEEHRYNGVFKDYFPDDIERSEYTYKDGKKNGPFKEFYEKGNWVTESETDKFGNEYPVQRLHDTQVKREGQYKDGQLDGEIITYTEEGKVEKKEHYANGERID